MPLPLALPHILVLVLAGASPASAEAVGLNLDVGLATMYNWRGLNMYADSSLQDQNMALSPGLTWSPGEGAFTVSYWSSYQLTGDNKQANVDLGTGAESDLTVSWTPSLTESFALGPILYVYAYPFSKWDVVGATFPNYLEPGLALAWSGPLEIGATVTYMTSAQEALRDYSYAYVGPTCAWSTDLSDAMSLDVGGKAGLKLAKGSGYPSDDNTWDAGVDLGVTWAPSDRLYVSPAVHGAWTNMEILEIGDELMFWGSVNVGTDL